jgi:hypothetical protein
VAHKEVLIMWATHFMAALVAVLWEVFQQLPQEPA